MAKTLTVDWVQELELSAAQRTALGTWLTGLGLVPAQLEGLTITRERNQAGNPTVMLRVRLRDAIAPDAIGKHHTLVDVTE